MATVTERPELGTDSAWLKWVTNSSDASILFSVISKDQIYSIGVNSPGSVSSVPMSNLFLVQ